MIKGIKNFFENFINNNFSTIILLIVMGLMGLMLGAAFLLVKDVVHEDNHNYIKYRAEFEGRQAYISYLENNKSMSQVDLSNVKPDDGRHPHIDINWSYNDGDKYLTLLNTGDISEFNEKTKYDFYTSLCRSIQDTRSDYFEKEFDYYVMPVERTLNDIDENLDCIFDGEKFKIIYLLDKKFTDAPERAPILF